jgi:hypothetical protein
LRCDSTGSGCTAIATATGASYTVVQEDQAHTLRYQETITNNDGSATAESEAFGPIAASSSGGSGGAGANGSSSTNATNGANGSNGTPGVGGPGGSATVDVLGSGSNLGSVLLGSSAKWSISLRVSPTRVRRHTKIRLTGIVSTSPRPGTGKLVFLQARSASTVWKGTGHARHRARVFGRWVTFQEFRARSNGTFSSSYTFKLGGHHLYQFQAVAPAEGQYRNPTGISPAVSVSEI